MKNNSAPTAFFPIVPRRYPLVLGGLAIVFAFRVAGQLLTAFVDVSFLPPYERWYSGIIPYSLLLPLQIVLIAVMAAIVRDFARGCGFFTTLAPRTGLAMKHLAYLYAFVMVVRYAVTMELHPELRWFIGTTPIWFHFVLALFLFTLGHYHANRIEKPD